MLPLHRYTYADYVALEESSPTKHEFLVVDAVYRTSLNP